MRWAAPRAMPRAIPREVQRAVPKAARAMARPTPSREGGPCTRTTMTAHLTTGMSGCALPRGRNLSPPPRDRNRQGRAGPRTRTTPPISPTTTTPETARRRGQTRRRWPRRGARPSCLRRAQAVTGGSWLQRARRRLRRHAVQRPGRRRLLIALAPRATWARRRSARCCRARAFPPMRAR